VAKIRALAIEERGNEAFCDSPEEPGKKVRFVKAGGGWRLDVGRDMPAEAEARKQIRQMKDLADAVRTYRKAIGKPGIRPEGIDAELGRELMKRLKGLESKEPHRFDINKL
jgi:hypothetical protein